MGEREDVGGVKVRVGEQVDVRDQVQVCALGLAHALVTGRVKSFVTRALSFLDRLRVVMPVSVGFLLFCSFVHILGISRQLSAVLGPGLLILFHPSWRPEGYISGMDNLHAAHTKSQS